MGVITNVQMILNDTGTFWPNQQVLDAINESQFHIFAETKWAVATGSFNLSSGVDVFTIPPQILIPKWIEGTNLNFQPAVVKRFFPTTQRQLEHFLRQWRGDNTGQPVAFSLWDATHFRCYPRPDGKGSGPQGSYPFTLFGIGYPAEIGTDVPIVGPPNYVSAVEQYAAALLLEATRPDLADLYLSHASDQILAFRKQLRNQQSHNIRTLRPATTQMELQQAGDINELPTYYPLEA
jgi:hypothetical protein